MFFHFGGEKEEVSITPDLNAESFKSLLESKFNALSKSPSNSNWQLKRKGQALLISIADFFQSLFEFEEDEEFIVVCKPNTTSASLSLASFLPTAEEESIVIVEEKPTIQQKSTTTTTTTASATTVTSSTTTSSKRPIHRPTDCMFFETIAFEKILACCLDAEQMISNGFPSQFDVAEHQFRKTTPRKSTESVAATLAVVTRVLAIDCEMVTTKLGKELARCTVVSSRYAVLYDS